MNKSLAAKDFAYSTLLTNMTTSQTTLDLASGAGSLFPATSDGQFMIICWRAAYTTPNADSYREIMRCTSRSGDTLTVVRAQEGTTEYTWQADDQVAIMVSANYQKDVSGRGINPRVFGDTYSEVEIQAALTMIGGDYAEIVLTPGVWNIGANLTLPAEVTLTLVAGASVVVATNVTLTVHGPLNGFSSAQLTGAGTISILGSSMFKDVSGLVLNKPVTQGGDTLALVSQLIPPGTVMLFHQTTVPVGWTLVTTSNDFMLRVVSDIASGGDSGGSLSPIDLSHSHGNDFLVASHTLTIAEIPAHSHSYLRVPSTASYSMDDTHGAFGNNTTYQTGNTGGGLGHSHNFTGGVLSSTLTPKYLNVVLCAKDAYS